MVLPWWAYRDSSITREATSFLKIPIDHHVYAAETFIIIEYNSKTIA